MQITDTDRPLGVAMWDFSWLERAYPGGGFEDWDRALAELTDRGYDVVRIDAFPHLIAADAPPDGEWTLPPNDMVAGNEWGAPGVVTVDPLPELARFLDTCADHDVLVGLSTWFREDETDARMAVETPDDFASVWVDALSALEDSAATGLDQVCYVDLCNEFPGWVRGGDLSEDATADPDLGSRWIADGVAGVRDSFPGFDYTVSFGTTGTFETRFDVDPLDFLEPHVWMRRVTDFWAEVEAASAYENHYDALADAGGEVYRRDRERWLSALREAIADVAAWSREVDQPLVTTESWGVVHARDWPRLEWDWIKDLCAVGTREALETGRWVGVSTSNFCEPQYVGMWADAEWHRELTDEIHAAEITT